MAWFLGNSRSLNVVPENVRLHSAMGYFTPADKLVGLDEAILAERDRKLEVARKRRQEVRQTPREVA